MREAPRKLRVVNCLRRKLRIRTASPGSRRKEITNEAPRRHGGIGQGEDNPRGREIRRAFKVARVFGVLLDSRLGVIEPESLRQSCASPEDPLEKHETHRLPHELRLVTRSLPRATKHSANRAKKEFKKLRRSRIDVIIRETCPANELERNRRHRDDEIPHVKVGV